MTPCATNAADTLCLPEPRLAGVIASIATASTPESGASLDLTARPALKRELPPQAGLRREGMGAAPVVDDLAIRALRVARDAPRDDPAAPVDENAAARGRPVSASNPRLNAPSSSRSCEMPPKPPPDECFEALTRRRSFVRKRCLEPTLRLLLGPLVVAVSCDLGFGSSAHRLQPPEQSCWRRGARRSASRRRNRPS